MRTLYFIRHGMTDSNKLKSFQGRHDNPLNAEGVEQAAELAGEFRDIRIDSIYCSPMLRARQTAKPLAEAKNLEIKIVNEFQEVSFGEWEGMEYDEINSRWPEAMNEFLYRPGHFIPPGGRPFKIFTDEAYVALKRILDGEQDNRQIAIVGHGGLTRMLVCRILEMPLDKMWALSMGNCHITTFTEYEGRLTLIGYNAPKIFANDFKVPID